MVASAYHLAAGAAAAAAAAAGTRASCPAWVVSSAGPLNFCIDVLTGSNRYSGLA